MHYVYILKSVKFGSIFIGYSKNLTQRIKEHNAHTSKYTGERGTWELVYYEAYKSKDDAVKREHMLKQYGATKGHLKKRITNSLL